MHRLVASWFGTGLILHRLRGSHAGSGTLGGTLALGMSLLLYRWGLLAQLAGLVVVTGLSLWSVRPFVTDDDGDPGWVVVDEAAGTLLATIGLGGWAAVVGWLVFRAADIFKNAFPGVARAEALPGPAGVTADDLVAGLYGLAAGWGFAALF
ncbi:MAG: phosphatidylglycerophosphatase A [Acidimicrobiia bacterium]